MNHFAWSIGVIDSESQLKITTFELDAITRLVLIIKIAVARAEQVDHRFVLRSDEPAPSHEIGDHSPTFDFIGRLPADGVEALRAVSPCEASISPTQISKAVVPPPPRQSQGRPYNYYQKYYYQKSSLHLSPFNLKLRPPEASV
jgi:hypothetical protein